MRQVLLHPAPGTQTAQRALLTVALLVLALCCMAPAAAHAQAAQASLTLDPSRPATMTVGDLLALTLDVTHPADTVAILPDMGPTWGDFEIREASAPATTSNEDGSLTTRKRLLVTLFAPGSFSTPPVAVRVTNRGGTTYEVVAPSVAVNVQSVLTEADPQLRDLKAQAQVQGAWRVVALATAGAALALALGGWWLWRRGVFARLGARTSLDRSLGELDALAAQGLVQQGKFKELYLAVSLTVRRHVARELGIDVEERTTREVRALLRKVALPAPVARRLLDLLTECDLVKFAEVTPTAEGAGALLGEARTVVRELSGARAAAAPPSAAPLEAGSRP